MNNAVLIAIDRRPDGRATGIFVGIDSRGLVLEIGVAARDDQPDVWVVLHVMPFEYSKRYKRK